MASELWQALKDWLRDEDCLVVGAGPSSFETARKDYRARWVLGCNRSVAICSPDFGVCVEPFRDACWDVMRAIPLPIVFSHLYKDRRGNSPHPRVVQFPSKDVRTWLCEEWDEKAPELWCAMSPFWGAAIAAYLGFRRIGLVGVDLTEDRYPDVRRECAKWSDLVVILSGRGQQLLNCSEHSRLTTVPYAPIEDIAAKRTGPCE